MATRRKKVSTNGSAAREFAVVVEQMQSQFKVFGEQLQAQGEVLSGQMQALDQRLSGQMQALDQRLSGQIQALDQKLSGRIQLLDDKVTAGFEQVDLRFERVEHEIGLLKIAVIEQGRELKKKVDRDEVEAIVERVVARAPRH